MGYRKAIIRSDGEPSLLSCIREAVTLTAELQAIWRTSPPEDHQANGGAERAVQEVKAHTKISIADLMEKLPGVSLSSPIFQWAPRHAAACISRYRILECGRTAEELRSGRRWRRPTILFGETAHFSPAGQRARGSANTVKGVFAGVHERTGACMFLTAGGCRRGTRIVRLPPEERWDNNFLEGCTGYPWDLKGQGQRGANLHRKRPHHLQWSWSRLRVRSRRPHLVMLLLPACTSQRNYFVNMALPTSVAHAPNWP